MSMGSVSYDGGSGPIVLAVVFVLCAVAFVVSWKRLEAIRHAPIADVEKQIPRTVLGVAQGTALIAGTVALELAIYLLTGNHWLEAASALVVGGGAGFAAFRRFYDDINLPQPSPYEIKVMRVNVAVNVTNAAFLAIMGLHTISRWSDDAQLGMMAEVIFAGTLFFIPICLINAYFVRRRSSKAHEAVALH